VRIVADGAHDTDLLPHQLQCAGVFCLRQQQCGEFPVWARGTYDVQL
jgi:hypothetical protein